jgi:ankyrin repeat protein
LKILIIVVSLLALGFGAYVFVYLSANWNPTGSNSVPGGKIHQAADAQDLDKLREVLKAGGDPNERDEIFQTTPLHAASRSYGAEMEILLDAGADPNLKDNFGSTALEAFIRSRNWRKENQRLLEIIKIMAEKGLDLKTHPRIITAAVETTDVEVVRLLIELGSPLNAFTKDSFEDRKYSLLNLARDPEVYRYLVDEKKVLLGQSETQFHPLVNSIRYADDYSKANYLLYHARVREDVNIPAEDGVTPLMAAVLSIQTHAEPENGWEEKQNPQFWELLKNLKEAGASMDIKSNVVGFYWGQDPVNPPKEIFVKTPREIIEELPDQQFKAKILETLK